jgi:tetratricopeptide (TPR) repeat protein
MKRLIHFLIFTMAAVSLQAVTHAELFVAGQQALRADDAEKAADLFEKATSMNPNDAEYHYYLGRAYGRLAQSGSLFKQASMAKKTMNEFERAVELDPDYIDGRFALLEYYITAPGIVGGSEEKAAQQAAEIKKRDSLTGHRAYARIYSRQKKEDLALKEMIASVREQPNSAKAHYFYASYLLGQKNYKGASEEFEAAIRLDATYMPPYFRIGQTAALSQTNHGRGAEALTKYLTYKPAADEPRHERTWYWLGRIYEDQGKKTDAKAAYQNSLRLLPKSEEVAEALKRVS